MAYIGRKIAGYTVKEIANYFKRSGVAIGEGIIKVEELGGASVGTLFKSFKIIQHP